MGLSFATTKWLDRLWSEHLDISQSARDLVQQGIAKQGPPFAGFPADLHARLYLTNDPPALDAAPAWATRLHDLASELGEWQRLRVMCARNGFAAGIAAEAMLETLLPHVPEAPAAQPQPSGAGAGDQPQSIPQTPGAGAQGSEQPGQDSQRAHSDSELRAAIRRAARAARVAVRNAEAGLEGLSTPLGLSMPGTSVVTNAGPADLKRIRDAHSRLSSSRRLKRIAELAGRLERVAAQKARSKVKPGVGEVHGIGLGGLSDLARLLPSELVALRRPALRLHLLARLLQGKALVYAMQGREPQKRGPIVICLDESSSMREAAKDIWSKSVALALLSTAAKQRRAFVLVAFNGAVTREVEIAAGKATPADISQALDHACRGGTDFNAPVLRAVEIIRTAPTMKQADVVMITDGEDSLEPATVDKARELTRTEGVSFFCIGVGPSAEQGLQSLAPIATSMVRVRNTDDADELVAPVINLSE